MNFITKTQSEIEKEKTIKKNFYNFGELHPHLLGAWDEDYSKKDTVNIMISHIGKYELPRNTFKKYKCPVCGKMELEIYDCFASVLSGANVLRGVCKSCNEIIALNDSDIYHEIRDYLLKNEKRNAGGAPKVLVEGKKIEVKS